MLSVVTIVRNRNQQLEALLAGLDRQTPQAQFEVVIADVGGTERPECVANRFPSLDITVERVAAEEGVAFPYAAARNAAAGSAVGDSLLFLDADTIPAAGTVSAFAAVLKDVDAIVTGEVRYLPPTTTGRYSDFDEDLLALSRPHPSRPVPPAEGITLGADPNMLWSVCLAMRTTTFDRVGGFDTSYVGYGAEDTDLTWAAHRIGVPAALVGGATVFHQHHSSHEPPLHHTDALVNNAQRFHRKWGRWPMQGWLSQMSAMGLINWSPSGDGISVRRQPTRREIDDSRQDLAAPFRHVP